MIGQQRVHCLRKFLIEYAPITSSVKMMQVTMLVCYLVEETTEEFRMLCFFPEKGGKIEFLFYMPLLRYHHQQWQQVKCHTFFTCLKERGQIEQRSTLILI